MNLDALFKFKIGSVVQYINGVSGQHRAGRVMSRELREDACGVGEWYNVRWVNPCGEPELSTVLLRVTEVEIHE